MCGRKTLLQKQSDRSGKEIQEGSWLKVTVAIDSFKGSMSSMEAGTAAREGILKACDAQVIVKPLADGGEGTTEGTFMPDMA